MVLGTPVFSDKRCESSSEGDRSPACWSSLGFCVSFSTYDEKSSDDDLGRSRAMAVSPDLLDWWGASTPAIVALSVRIICGDVRS